MYTRYNDIFVILLNLPWKKLGGRNWKITPLSIQQGTFNTFLLIDKVKRNNLIISLQLRTKNYNIIIRKC